MFQLLKLCVLGVGLVVALSGTAGSAPPPVADKEPPQKSRLTRPTRDDDQSSKGTDDRTRLAGMKQKGRVLCLALAPDGRTLASGGDDKAIHLWDVRTGKEVRQLKGHEAGIMCLAFAPQEGGVLASGGWDKTIRLWDISTGREVGHRIQHPNVVTAIVFSPDGKRLASGAGGSGGGRPNPNIYLWDKATGKEVRHWRAHRGGVSALAFSPDGKRLASGGLAKWEAKPKEIADPYALALWDTATGKKIQEFKGHSLVVRAVAFSPDGTVLASLGYDQQDGRCAYFWDPASGDKRLTMKRDIRDPRSLAFAPDGKKLAVGDSETIGFYEVPEGKQLPSLRNAHPQAVVWSVVFFPDGKVLASGGTDGCVRLWDVAKGKERFSVPSELGPSIQREAGPKR